MQIDLANWFEIIAAFTAVVCCIIKPQRITIVLAVLLVATVAVEFSSKYLSDQHRITHNLSYIYVKLAMYALLYNSLSFCGNLAIIYLLTNDKENKNQYIWAGAIMIVFTIFNFLFGQGYKTYNNYSTAFSWFLLVAFALYKLRTYPEHILSRHRNFVVLLFVLTIVFYYSINMPFFVFFQQMFAKDRSAGVTLYRVINDGANYPLYTILALIAVLLSTKESKPMYRLHENLNLADILLINAIATLVVFVTIFLLLLVAYIIVEKITSIKKKIQHTKEMTELKHNYEQTLLRSQLEIQEETLRHISQEIHDNIGQVLSLAKLQLNTLPVPPLQENLEAFTITKQLVSKAITDLRSLSKSLHPDRVNELGLEENIRHELDMLQKTHLYKTQLQINGSIYKIPVQTQTILFRMVQEAISNIIKHASATTIEVVMDYEPAQFCLAITDNGVGIKEENLLNHAGGIGIRNMQNRSGIIGASFSITPVNGGGTMVRICLPAGN